MIKDDVDYFNNMYCCTGSATLMLNVNWPYPEKPVEMKLACDFTDEEKSAYVMQHLDTREKERKRVEAYLAGKRLFTAEEWAKKRSFEHDADINQLQNKFPGNYWWGKRPVRKTSHTTSHVSGKI